MEGKREQTNRIRFVCKVKLRGKEARLNSQYS